MLPIAERPTQKLDSAPVTVGDGEAKGDGEAVSHPLDACDATT
jgi:hypothetical protein